MSKYGDYELKATRYGYGEGLVELGHENNKVVALGGDITSSTAVNFFKNEFPDRFYSIGIAEQNMATVASGLALAGYVPFYTTYGVFAAGRCWDQIRTTICYNELNVKIGSGHAGVSVGPDGATHQALEDIALVRTIPNITVVSPADAIETKKATLAIGRMFGPAIVRFGREAVPIVTKEDTPFELGKGYIFKEDGTDVAIIATGAMVWMALEAMKLLRQEGINARLINLHTIKPIDKEIIVKAAPDCGAIVTCEEHQIHGGFGSAIAEVIVANEPEPMEFVGVQDRFGEAGPPELLWTEFNLDKVDIVNAVKKVLARTKK